MKALALLILFALLSLPLPLSAKEQTKSHKTQVQLTKSTQKNQKYRVEPTAEKQPIRLREARFFPLYQNPSCWPYFGREENQQPQPEVTLTSGPPTKKSSKQKPKSKEFAPFVLDPKALEGIYGQEESSGPPPYFGFERPFNYGWERRLGDFGPYPYKQTDSKKSNEK